MHLRDWGFIKNRKISSCPPPLGPEIQPGSPLPMPKSTMSFPEERSIASTVKEQGATSNAVHPIQPSKIPPSEVGDVRDYQQYIRQAGAATLGALGLGATVLGSLKVSRERMQNDPSVMEVGSANLVRESQYQSSLLDQYRRTWEQFPPDAPLWHAYLGSGNANDLRLYLDTMY